jgi:hypothetical protein
MFDRGSWNRTQRRYGTRERRSAIRNVLPLMVATIVIVAALAMLLVSGHGRIATVTVASGATPARLGSAGKPHANSVPIAERSVTTARVSAGTPPGGRGRAAPRKPQHRAAPARRARRLRHFAPPPATYVAAGAHNSSGVSQNAGLADRAAQTPTAPSAYHPAASGATSSPPVASQPAVSRPVVSQPVEQPAESQPSQPAVSQPAASPPAGPTGFGHVIGNNCNPQCR